MERYVKLFLEQYESFKEDIIATFPEYENELPKQPETDEAAVEFARSVVEPWQSAEVKVLIAREDLAAFPAAADDTSPPPIPFRSILEKCSDDNKKIVWKYIKSFMVFGTALSSSPGAILSEEYKKKFIDSVDDGIFDSKQVEEARAKTNSEFFNIKDTDSEEMKFMKRIFKKISEAVIRQMRGKNKKAVMKKLLSGDHEKVINLKKLQREVQPLIAEMEQKIERGELSEEKFRTEVLRLVEDLQSQSGSGEAAGFSEMFSKLGFKGGLGNLLPKYEKFKAEDHMMPKLDDLPPMKSKPNKRRRRR